MGQQGQHAHQQRCRAAQPVNIGYNPLPSCSTHRNALAMLACSAAMAASSPCLSALHLTLPPPSLHLLSSFPPPSSQPTTPSPTTGFHEGALAGSPCLREKDLCGNKCGKTSGVHRLDMQWGMPAELLAALVCKRGLHGINAGTQVWDARVGRAFKRSSEGMLAALLVALACKGSLVRERMMKV